MTQNILVYLAGWFGADTQGQASCIKVVSSWGYIVRNQEGVEEVLSDDVHTDCLVLRPPIFLVEPYLGTSSCPLLLYCDVHPFWNIINETGAARGRNYI